MKRAIRQHKHKTLAIKQATQPKLIDRLVYFAAVVEPLFSLPQSLHIFRTQSAAGVSILSWIGFELMTLIWLWYGVAHRDRTILIYQGLFFIIDGSVVVGALLYGGSL